MTIYNAPKKLGNAIFIDNGAGSAREPFIGNINNLSLDKLSEFKKEEVDYKFKGFSSIYDLF